MSITREIVVLKGVTINSGLGTLTATVDRLDAVTRNVKQSHTPSWSSKAEFVNDVRKTLTQAAILRAMMPLLGQEPIEIDIEVNATVERV